LEEEIIRLLGERLVVDRGKRKIGEVIVRRNRNSDDTSSSTAREMIVEQVSPERKQLAEINLGEERSCWN